MKTIDLNCDMGESFDNYTIGMDDEVMPYITSANIACGWYAGDSLVMDAAIRAAKTHGVGAAGAHPGYPDLMGFGRRKMALTPEEIKSYLIYQIGALQGLLPSLRGNISACQTPRGPFPGCRGKPGHGPGTGYGTRIYHCQRRLPHRP